MDWEEVVSEFRHLGGVVDNVRLDEGPLGRGLFVIDPTKPATVRAPETLFAPIDRLELRDGRLCLREGTLGERERAFFDAYQHHFAWGAGVLEDQWRAQEAWHRCPPEIAQFVMTMGGLHANAPRFAEPTLEVCGHWFVRSRCFTHNGGEFLVPMVELVNHSSTAAGYVYDPGIGVDGTFEREMLVRYNSADSWAFAMSYGFSDQMPFAYSLAITVDLFGTHQFSVLRDPASVRVEDGVRYPRLQIDGNMVRLPNLMLGNLLGMDTPRGVFRAITRSMLTTTQADDTFESIQQFNRSKFVTLLRMLRNERSPLANMLQDAALNQLHALNACVGARSL